MTNLQIIEKAKKSVAVRRGYAEMKNVDKDFTEWEVALKMTNRKAVQKELFEEVFNEIVDLLKE